MISTNNYNKTSFGMSVKVGKDAMGIIQEELTPKAAKKFAKIVETQKNNPVDILVGTTPTGNLKVGTAGKTFYTNDSIMSYFRSESSNIINTMKKAAKHADEHAAKKEALKGIDIIG